MKSFVEQSERHYVSVPRHHLWSRIYIILRVLVFHICRVYVSVCISMCLHVCGCICVSLCTTILSPFLTFSLSLSHIFFFIFSLSHPFTRVLSFLSLSPFFLSRPFALLSPHIRTCSFRPLFSPSLSYFLTFRVRSLLSFSLSMYQ